jgi:acyl carrier protein phosphodiesterase
LYSPGVIAGIKLHHKIDEYTDSHSIVSESKKRLRPKYGKYSAVIVDIFYDHFLALDWYLYSKIPLEEYAVKTYELIYENIHLMPPKVQQILPYMISEDWLFNYSNLEGIQSTLKGMSRRARFESGMEKSIEDLRIDYELYRKEFHDFFPQLQKFVNNL